MKFTVTLKDPDCLHDVVREAVVDEVNGIHGLSDEEREELVESRSEKERANCRKWFEYGEYLRVEVDTAAGTCVVVPVNGGAA